jgi:hypothetical protein
MIDPNKSYKLHIMVQFGKNCCHCLVKKNLNRHTVDKPLFLHTDFMLYQQLQVEPKSYIETRYLTWQDKGARKLEVHIQTSSNLSK